MKAVLPVQPWPRAVCIAACGLATLLMLPHVLSTFQHGMAMVVFPWQVDFDEGVVLHSAYLIARGQNPYPPLQPDRFVSSTYPPFYYLLLAAWQRLGDMGMGFGRALSLASSAVGAMAVAWVATRLGGGFWSGAAGAALFLGNGLVWVWGSFQKPDMMALAMELLGVCLMLGTGGSAPYLAVVPFLLAFFTKQTAVVGLVAAAIYMAAQRRGQFVRWSLLAVGLMALGYLTMELVSGRNYTLHIVEFQAAIPWRWSQLEHQLAKLWSNNGLLVAAGLLGWTLSWKYPRVRLLSIYGLVALVETFAINGRTATNYGLLLITLPTLSLFSALMPCLLSRGGRWEMAGATALAGLLVLAAATSAPGNRWYSMGRMPEVAVGTRYLEMARLVAAQPGPALSENSQILLAAGKQVLFDDTFMMGWAARSGLWDDTALVRMLRERQFGVLLFEKDPTRLSADAQAALAEAYYLAYRDYLNIWLPRSR